MMKRWVVFLFVFLLLMLGSKEAFGATGPEGQQSTNFGGESVASQLERIDVTELKVFWEDIVENYGGYLPESQKGSFIDFINGEKSFHLKNG